MSVSPFRVALFLIAFIGLSSGGSAQAPREQIAFQPNFAAAQRTAKTAGLPVMVVVRGKSAKLSEPLGDRRVIKQSSAFVCVAVPADSAVAKKLDDPKAGSVLFLDEEGATVAQVEADASAEQLLKEMTGVLDKSRAAVLERLLNGKDVTSGKEAANQTAAFNSYVRLGATTTELIPLLTHKNPKVKSALGVALAARLPEGADWALLNAMASSDAEIRAGCHPVAIAVTKATKVPPASFWKDATEEERAAALEKWREGVYGKLPPVNKAILDFCFDHYGKQVDNGECAMLAVLAVRSAKARPMQNKDKTYVWGETLGADDTVLAGDIVQLENAKFSDGIQAPHHTQIIRRVLGKGQYQVLEQNSNGRRTVGLGKINLKLLTQGTVVIYRPQPLASDRK